MVSGILWRSSLAWGHWSSLGETLMRETGRIWKEISEHPSLDILTWDVVRDNREFITCYGKYRCLGEYLGAALAVFDKREPQIFSLYRCTWDGQETAEGIQNCFGNAESLEGRPWRQLWLCFIGKTIVSLLSDTLEMGRHMTGISGPVVWCRSSLGGIFEGGTGCVW